MHRTLAAIKTALYSETKDIPHLLQPDHLPALDGLRGISIIIVTVYHILLANGYDSFNGMFGVNIFFVVSGFIITTLLLKEKCNTGSVSLRNFYARRALKILPPAFLYLSVVFLLNSHYQFITTQDILSAVLFIKNTHIIPTHWDAATGHFWSLSVEEQFYLVFPFILKKSTRGYLIVLVLMIVLIPVLLATEHSSDKDSLHAPYDMIRYMAPILTGSVFAILIFKGVIVKKIYPNKLVPNLLLLVAAYFIYDGTGLFKVLCYKNFISSVLIAMLVVNNITEQQSLFSRILNSKVLVAIGLASYSVYIWQQLFIFCRPWAAMYSFAEGTWFNLGAMIFVSLGSYYFIEKKLAILRSRYR